MNAHACPRTTQYRSSQKLPSGRRLFIILLFCLLSRHVLGTYVRGTKELDKMPLVRAQEGRDLAHHNPCSMQSFSMSPVSPDFISVQSAIVRAVGIACTVGTAFSSISAKWLTTLPASKMPLLAPLWLALKSSSFGSATSFLALKKGRWPLDSLYRINKKPMITTIQ